MDREKLYQKARQRVEEIKGFYMHLIMYIAVNAGLFLINRHSSPGHWWFYYPLFGWGIGLIAHAVSVFGIPGILGEEWEERKIEKLVKKMEERQSR